MLTVLRFEKLFSLLFLKIYCMIIDCRCYSLKELHDIEFVIRRMMQQQQMFNAQQSYPTPHMGQMMMDTNVMNQ